MTKQHKLLIKLTIWWLSTLWSNIFTSSCLFVFSEEADVNFIRPNFFRTITKLFSRHFGGNLKKIGRVSTKRKWTSNYFIALVSLLCWKKDFHWWNTEKHFSLVSSERLIKALIKYWSFPNSMVREQELLGRIDKVCTLVQQQERFIKKRMKTYVT